MLQCRLHLFLFISLVFAPSQLVVAIPRIVPRQLDNSIWDIDWGKIFTGIGSFGTYLDFLQDGQQDTPTTTIPGQQGTTTPVDPQAESVPGQASEPNYELGQPPESPNPRVQAPSAPPPQCDTTNIFSSDCGRVLDQLIFTTSCEKISKDQRPTAMADALNDAILAALITMAPGVKTSKSGYCGIFMFKARLTAEQSRNIARMPGVSRVTSDIFLEVDASDGSGDNPQPQPGVTEPAIPLGQLRKRDIVRQQAAPGHLRFLSRPPSYQGPSTDYVYDSSAGADTEVISLGGSSVTIRHPEFEDNPILRNDFIFSFGSPGDNPDTRVVMGLDGTCVASLIKGSRCGVSKRTKLIPVIIDSGTLGSVIAAMVGIGDHFLARDSNPDRAVLGSVLLISISWTNTNPEATERFKQMLDFLIDDYNVVTVVPAGIAFAGVAGPMELYPAVYSLTTSVIAVGSVDLDGARFPWSPTAEGLIYAPGSVQCASNDGRTPLTTRPSVASAQTAGLAAYFLGLYAQLRADPNAEQPNPFKVRDFITSVAWARSPGGVKSIWNLMGPETPDPSGDLMLPNGPY